MASSIQPHVPGGQDGVIHQECDSLERGQALGIGLHESRQDALDRAPRVSPHARDYFDQQPVGHELGCFDDRGDRLGIIIGRITGRLEELNGPCARVLCLARFARPAGAGQRRH